MSRGATSHRGPLADLPLVRAPALSVAEAYDAFAVQGSTEHGVIASWLGGRIAVVSAAGIFPCLFLVSSTPQRLGGLFAVTVAVVATAVHSTRIVADATMNITFHLTLVMIACLGIPEGPIQPLVPAIYALMGLVLFVSRSLRFSLLRVGSIGIAYAVVLLLGPDADAPMTRWIVLVTTVLTTGLCVRWVVGHVVHLAGEERAASAEARRAAGELEEESRAKTAFLASMSHELRTPLHAILGFSDLLEVGAAGELTDQQRDFLGDIAAAGQDLLLLVDDLLDLSKVESGAVELTFAPVDLGQAVADAALVVRGRASARDIELTVSVPDHPVTADADALRIRQVAWNLIGNAVKFTPSGGRVAVSVVEVDDRVAVEVTDTGPGIAPDDLERVFGRFERAPSEAEGTGIGLALCRRLVQAHGGELTATSELGVGSAFRFEIPVGHLLEPDLGHDAPAEQHDLDLDRAFLVPGSVANRSLLARLSAWCGMAAAGLLLVVALVTPAALPFRLAVVGVAAGSLVWALLLGRLRATSLPRYSSLVITVGGLASVCAAAPAVGSFKDLAPMAFGWTILTSAMFLTRVQLVGHLAAIAVSYGTVLIIDRPPDALQLWIAAIMLVLGNVLILGWVSDRLRDAMSETLGSRLVAEATRVRAEAVSTHKSEFAANTSHELCTPLIAIIGFAELLEDREISQLTPKQAEYVDHIRQAGVELLALIRELLDLAKLEAGRYPTAPEQVEIGDLAEQVLVDTASRAAQRGIPVSLVLDPDLSAAAVDPTNLRRALTRLLANAVDYTPDGGRIEVSGRRDESGTVRIAVRDTGIGIAPEHHADVFDAFRHGAGPVGPSSSAGTGLGLTIARGLIELEGGTISLESTPDVGSTFTVCLPAR